MTIGYRGTDLTDSGDTSAGSLSVTLASASAQAGDYAMIVASSVSSTTTYTNNRSGWTATSRQAVGSASVQCWHKRLTATDISDLTVSITLNSAAVCALGLLVLSGEGIVLDSVSPNPNVTTGTGDETLPIATIDPVGVAYMANVTGWCNTYIVGEGPTGDPTNWPGGYTQTVVSFGADAGVWLGTYNLNPTSSATSAVDLPFATFNTVDGASWTFAFLETGGGTAAPWLATPPGRRAPASQPQIRQPDARPQVNVPLKSAPQHVEFPTVERQDDASHWDSNSLFGSRPTPATWERVNNRAHSGQWSLKVTWPDPTLNTDGYAWVNSWPTVPGQGTYYDGDLVRASAWVYVPSGNPDPCIEVAFRGLGTRTGVKDEWVEISFTWLQGAAGSGQEVFPGVNVQNPTAGQVCWVDDIRVETIDFAQAITFTQDNWTRYLTSPSEIESARPLTKRTKSKAVGLVTETDSLLSPSRAKRKAIGYPAETDLASMNHRIVYVDLGLAWE